MVMGSDDEIHNEVYTGEYVFIRADELKRLYLKLAEYELIYKKLKEGKITLSANIDKVNVD